MARPTLDDVFDGDDALGLLTNVKVPCGRASNVDETILQRFDEINAFIDKHGYIPGEGATGSVSERGLQIRLSQYRSNAELKLQLAEHDRHSLLCDANNAPKSIDDILDMDDPLLSAPADDIFKFRHARPAASIPDKISKRKVCEDFDFFKPLLEKCAAEIKEGIRQAKPFTKEQEINPGNFFILNGVMVYIAEVNDPHIRGGKKNARLRLIFDNGTEGENLLRSLAVELYKDPNGRRISDPKAGPLFVESPSQKDLGNVLEGKEAFSDSPDIPSGTLYVLRSLSPNPKITALDGTLFKIGFTGGDLKTRIQNTADDPTFLLAPVHPVATYAIRGATTNKIENIIHKFFSEARLNIEIPDRFGKKFKPREWFLVPQEVIGEAVERVIDGSIINYRFDVTRSEIIKK